MARVFVSYVQENRDLVTRLVTSLRERGLNVWFDREALAPGVFWREEIRSAIRGHEWFIACFSREFAERTKAYMNEELELAIEEIRQRGSAPWFIPVLLSGEIPDRAIGAGRTLRDIQFVDLAEGEWDAGIDRLTRTIVAGCITPQTPATSPELRSKVIDNAMISLSGSAQSATDFVKLEPGAWVAELIHSGQGHFGVWLLDSQGSKVELLVSTTGSFHGSKAFRIDAAGEYLFDVSANNPWRLGLHPPEEVEGVVAFEGQTQAGTKLVRLPGGLNVFRLHHEGSGHFGVWLLDKTGSKIELLTSVTGAFNGSKAVQLRGGHYYFDVSADGAWSVHWSRQ